MQYLITLIGRRALEPGDHIGVQAEFQVDPWEGRRIVNVRAAIRTAKRVPPSPIPAARVVLNRSGAGRAGVPSQSVRSTKAQQANRVGLRAQ